MSFFYDKSSIHGYGIFAKKEYKKGEFLYNAFIGDHQTIEGRLTNHSFTPNACLISEKKINEEIGEMPLRIYLIAKTNIEHGEEIVSDYTEFIKIVPEYMIKTVYKDVLDFLHTLKKQY